MERIICNRCDAYNMSAQKYCRECGYELPKPQIEEKVEETETKPQKPKSQLNLKSILGIIVGTIVAAVVSFAVQQLFFKPAIDKELMEIASEFNKSCPVMLDAETRLDNMTAMPNKTFQYNYSLINFDKEDIDTLYLKNFLEPNIVNNARTNPQMKELRDKKVTLQYYYKDRNGAYLFMISVKPKQYE